MPLYKGSCGCYNREDARELGILAAIIWNDIIDRSEHFGINPMWYDQKQAAERLGIEYNRLNRAVKTLVEAGRISTKNGFRPNSTTRTTWITILVGESEISNSNFGNLQNDDFGNLQNDDFYIKETKKRDLTERNTEIAISDNQKEKGNDEPESPKDPDELEHMLPSALYAKVRAAFPGSSNDRRKKKVEAIERLQNEFELSDETILAGIKEIGKHPTYTFSDGREYTETLTGLLLASDLEKTADKIVRNAEASEVKKKKDTVTINGKEVKIKKQLYGVVY